VTEDENRDSRWSQGRYRRLFGPSQRTADLRCEGFWDLLGGFGAERRILCCGEAHVLRWLVEDAAGAAGAVSGCRPGAWLDEPGFLSGDDGLQVVSYVQFGEYPGDVCFHGRLGDEQLGGDLGVT
jgi:hypothetical protein